MSSFITSSARFSKFDARNVILFQFKVFVRNINPFTPTRYPTWNKKIQLAFCNPHGGVKTISKEFRGTMVSFWAEKVVFSLSLQIF